MKCKGVVVQRMTVCLLLAAALWPEISLAQASPFLTGATGFLAELQAWALPIAAILIMVVGVLAMAGRLSAGTAVLAIVGIAIVFGAPQIVTWIRGMFGV